MRDGQGGSGAQRLRWLLAGLGLGLLMLAGYWYWQQRLQPEPVSVLTSDGVLARIQALNNLETVAFHIETIVQSQQAGNWYALWQDEQRALFVARGMAIAGIPLSQLTRQQITVSADGRQIHIRLPPAQVLSVGLTDVKTYDISTGLGNLVPVNRELLNVAQPAARRQIGMTACRSDIMKMATVNGQKQVQQLFSLLPDTTVTVSAAPVPACTIKGL